MALIEEMFKGNISRLVSPWALAPQSWVRGLSDNRKHSSADGQEHVKRVICHETSGEMATDLVAEATAELDQ